jgi:hypothetical protein
MLTDWQQRVIDEKKELDEKRMKLDAFMSTRAYYELVRAGNDQAPLLQRQYDYMTYYSRMLGERIAHFG